MSAPDFSAMTLPELCAWDAALRLAIAALERAGEGADAAILADDDWVTVTVSFSIAGPIAAPTPAETGETS